MRLSAHRAGWLERVQFFLVDDRPVDDWKYPQPFLLQPSSDGMAWERKQEGFSFPAPSFELTDDGAQTLFEMLWASGFRSKQQVNEASRIEAVTRHLEDMRSIAFDRLKVTAP